jgi:RHS repeat-associated protein
MAEYNNGALPSAPTNEYIYAGGQRIMSVQSGVTDYWHFDHLSPRLRTDASGNVADQRGTFPFGETWYSPGQSPYMFTTYYRDYESGNDYAQARYYVNRLARFSSPDPIPGSTSDPQSLNTYSYVESDPANLVDPLGLCPSPGICITVSAPYWPGGPSLPSTSAVFFGGAGPGDINAEGQIFARTGRGNTSGPRMRPEKPVPPCRIVDPFLAALEFTIKVGPEIQAGPVRLGGSLYENLTTGDTGVKIEGSVGLVGAQIDNPTPPGGNLGGTTEGTQTSVSFLGFEYNFTTHRFQFAPSKSFSLGLQLGVGGEVSFNSATFKQQSAANAACRTQGGN